MPDLLSASFTALVRAGGAQHPLTPDGRAALLGELALLEKGAAAMKVWPLEQLCTALIATYEARHAGDAGLPEQLLHELIRVLAR